MLFNKYNFKIHKFTNKRFGVFFSPQESVATDSFRLIRISKANGDIKDFPLIENIKPKESFQSFILSPKCVKDLEESIKRIENNVPLPILKNAVILKRNNEIVKFGITNLDTSQVLTARIEETEFPKYKELFAKYSNKGYRFFRLDGKALRDLIDFLQDFSASLYKEILIGFPKSEREPIHLKAEGKEGQIAEAMIMPMVGDD